MIGYVTVGTNDLGRASRFYDALLGTIGAARYMESDRFVAWTVSLARWAPPATLWSP